MGVKIIFFHMHGCGACAQAEPHLAAFEKAHPEIQVDRRDVHRMRWPKNANWRPRFTPSYLIEIPGETPHAYEYPLTQAQLERWVGTRTGGA
jgi:hypothetical protein